MRRDRGRRTRPLAISSFLALLALAALLLSACGNDGIAGTTPLPADTPIIYITGGIIGGDTTNGITAFSGRDGAQLWHIADEHSDQKPVLVGGVLFASIWLSEQPQQYAVAIRASDGKELWRTELPDDTFSNLIAADSTTVVVAANLNGLFALDAGTGAIRWHKPGKARDRPRLRDGVVYAAYSNDATDDPYTWRAFSNSDGSLLWKADEQGDPADIGGSSLFMDGKAISPEDGHTLWAAPAGETIVAADDQIVLTQMDDPTLNNTIYTALDAKDGHMLWQETVHLNPLSFIKGTWSRLANGDLYVPRQHSVTALRTSDGAQAWQRSFDQYNVLDLYIEGNVVFVLLEPPLREYSFPPCLSDCNGRIVALNGTTGEIYWQEDADWPPGTEDLYRFAIASSAP